jgi:hypothetical protein
MLTTVLILNTLIAILCLYITWQLTKLQQVLAKAADTLLAAERSTYNVLHPAPTNIIKGQTGTRQLRKKYQQLQHQQQQLQKILSLFNLTQSLWRQTNKTKKNQKKQNTQKPKT